MSARSTAAVAAILALAAGSVSGCGQGSAEPAKAQPAAGTQAAVRKAVTAKATPGAARDNAEADESFALSSDVKLTRKAPSPGAAKAVAKKLADAQASEDYISPGAPSDAQIARELEQMEAIQRKQTKTGGTAHGITLEADGTATPAPGVPAAVARVIAGANAIAKFPYVYGGGHGSFVDTAYDCSGSLSYALAAGGLLKRTMVSGELARTGEKGPGEWITIYAHAGHTFMVVDGLRFDTSGRSGPRGSRWQLGPRSTKGFSVRHPPGL